MKDPHPPPNPGRFNGNLRHYHRSGAQTQRSWEDWIDGPPAKRRTNRNWLKISAIVVSILALGGIITGLVIEMA